MPARKSATHSTCCVCGNISNGCTRHQFKDTLAAQNVQVARHRRRMTRHINHLRRLCFTQQLQRLRQTAFARRVEQNRRLFRRKLFQQFRQNRLHRRRQEPPVADFSRPRVAPRRLDGALVVFHADERFNRVRQFNAEKTDAAIQIRQMPRAAVAEQSAHGFHELRQQGKIVLEKRIRRHVPVFRRHAQNDLDSPLRRRMRADPLDFFVERRFGNFAFLDVLNQAAVPAHKTDVQLLLRFVPLAANHDAIAVAVRPGAGNHLRHPRLLKPANPLKQIGDLFVFQSKLRGVINVLILAAAALAEVPAGRFDAFRRRLHDS